MKRTLFFAFSIAAVVSLASCSGLPQTTGGGGGGGTTTGSTNLILTMTDTPPTNVSVLSSPTSIGSLVMEGVINNTNGDSLVKLGTVVAQVDLVRLQSDSIFLPAEGHAGPYVVVNGNYRALAPVISMNALTYFNQTGAAVKLDNLNDMCNDNSICVFATNSGFFGGTQEFATGGSSPLPIAIGGGTLSASIDLNQNALIASPNGFLTIDFSQPNAASLVALPRAGLPSGTLELAEDVIGTVTAVSGNTITIQPTGSQLFGNPLPLIADANSSTRFDNCGTTATIACIQTGQSVSVDAAVHADGTVTLLEVDKLSDTTGDELEGVIATVDATHQVFVIAVHNKLTAANSTDTTFQRIDLGGPVQVALGTGATFAVDTKGLPVPAANLSTFAGFSNLAPGQMVRVNVSSTGSSTTGTPYRQATVSSVTLRFSRLTGSAATVTPTGSLFNLDTTTIPPFFALTANPQVQVLPGFTNFDGVSDLTGVTNGDSVSIRALYLPNSAPPFFAAKVRKH